SPRPMPGARVLTCDLPMLTGDLPMLTGDLPMLVLARRHVLPDCQYEQAPNDRLWVAPTRPVGLQALQAQSSELFPRMFVRPMPDRTCRRTDGGLPIHLPSRRRTRL